MSAEEGENPPGAFFLDCSRADGKRARRGRAILLGVHTRLPQPNGRKEALSEIQSVNQGPTGGSEDDRSSFWKMVDRTKPDKLGVFSERELRDCQDYFAKLQSDSSGPLNEITIASERLTLIRSEIDGRHEDTRHRRTQRLACWAIGLAMISLTVAIGFGVSQFVAHRATHENRSANIGISPVTPSTPMETPSVAQEPPVAQEPTTTPIRPTPEPTVFAPVNAVTPPTSTPTAMAEATSRPRAIAKPRRKPATRRSAMKKAEPKIRVEEFLRSLVWPKPTKSPSAVRRP